MRYLAPFFHNIGLLASQIDDRQIHPHCNMSAVRTEKYCQFTIIFTKYWGNMNTYTPPQTSGDCPHAVPLNFPAMVAGLLVLVIAKVLSRYYRVPWYFFTVLTVRGAQSVVPPNTNLKLSITELLNVRSPI